MHTAHPFLSKTDMRLPLYSLFIVELQWHPATCSFTLGSIIISTLLGTFLCNTPIFSFFCCTLLLLQKPFSHQTVMNKWKNLESTPLRF
jgi:hypothetical protein